MELQPITLHHRNPIVTDYQANKMQDFFTYDPFTDSRKRYEDLQQRSFARAELVAVLQKMNKKWDAPLKTLQQIERLHDARSVVVIGGQQAGLLTGPTYTINKLISILQYAQQKEAELNVPVIPIFWIAGEDHDFAEINHVNTVVNNTLTKRILPQQVYLKQSVAHIELNKQLTKEWLRTVFNDFVETEHTKELYELLLASLQKADSFVDFFAQIIYRLFPNSGIVLVNSADPDLRQLEAPHFVQMIERQEAITEAVYHTKEKLIHAGYSLQVDVTQTDANLFYEHQHERILLKRAGAMWVGKNEEVALTTEELLTIARNEPEKLSNNVITRPLMQESLFPTLAFIAGDGEISYWALLKEAFFAYDVAMKMPPIVPRLSFTYITKRVAKLLQERTLDAHFIVNHGCQKLEMNWLAAQQQPPLDLIYDETLRRYEALHAPLQQIAKSISDNLGAEAERNWLNIKKELEYLMHRTKLAIEERYRFELAQFQEIANALRPNDVLQERVLNIFSFLNECGLEVLHELVHLPVDFTEEHYLIYF